MLPPHDLKLAPRTLGELRLEGFCPRCHWVKLRCEQKLPFQIPMPGIFSTLDSHVKKVVHAFLDHTGQLPDWFPDLGPIVGYQPALHWSKFWAVDQETGTLLRGVVDDFFQLEDGSLLIVDSQTDEETVIVDHCAQRPGITNRWYPSGGGRWYTWGGY